MGQTPTLGLRSPNYTEKKKSLWSIQVYNFICPCSVSGPSWGCYWSACPVLITRLAGRTTGPDALGLSELEKRSQAAIGTETHKHHRRSTKNASKHSPTWAKVWTGIHMEAKCIRRCANMYRTQAAGPICRGTVFPSRSLAPDCQGELRRRRWHVVSSSARCAADTADRRKHLPNLKRVPRAL